MKAYPYIGTLEKKLCFSYKAQYSHILWSSNFSLICMLEINSVYMEIFIIMHINRKMEYSET